MDQYEIVFKGEVMPNLEPDQVATALARLFNTSPDKITPLFNGKPHTLKSGLERAAAEKYRDTLKQAGAIVILRRLGIPERAAGSRAAARGNGGLSVAPMVGNLVRDEERGTVAALAVDISGIELAANDDAPLQPPSVTSAAAPDTDHLSIAEAGADLNPERPVPAPAPLVDTDAISLAPPDIERLVEPATEPDPPIPDTRALHLEPEGEILKPDEKPQQAAAPAIEADFDLYDPE